MSSVQVQYPVQVKSYQVRISRDRADVHLEGIEEAKGSKLRPVGNIVFGDPNPVADHDFIARGGFLRMDRPLEMLPAILDLLRHEDPVFLQGDGSLTTSLERAGEEES